jgi:hypothetical protein
MPVISIDKNIGFREITMRQDLRVSTGEEQR